MNKTETKKKKLKGVVVSNKMDKTIVVRIDRFVEHPKYKKYRTVSKKFKAHDDKNECKEGDVVIIEECKPISKDKNFTVVEIFKKDKKEETS